MLERPGRPVAIHQVAAQQQRPETLTRATAVKHRRAAQPTQIPTAFLFAGRDPHGDELTGAIKPHQPPRVATIGLDFLARSDRHQRRRHHVARDTDRRQQPIQLIAGRARLVTHPQPARLTQPAHQPTDRHLIMGDLLQPRRALRRPVEHPHRDRVSGDIEPYPLDTPTRHSGCRHGRLLSSMWLRPSAMVDDPRIKPGREPAVPLQLCAESRTTLAVVSAECT